MRTSHVSLISEGAIAPWRSGYRIEPCVCLVNRDLIIPLAATSRVRSMPRCSSTRLIAEFLRVVQATALGFLLMGGVAFLVKLIHIPLNNILVGA